LGKAGNFTEEQANRFWGVMAKLEKDMEQAMQMEQVEQMVLERRLASLKDRYNSMESALTHEEERARLEKDEAKRKDDLAVAEAATAQNLTSAIHEAKTAETALVRREGALKERVITITEETQQLLR